MMSIEQENNIDIKSESVENEQDGANEEEHGVPLTLTPEDIAEGVIPLDPKKSERKYWTDPATHVKREIWRPGDGDGDKTIDFFDQPGQLAPLEKRWRFYQSDTGLKPIKRDINEPPRFVILDDRTVHRLLESDMPRSSLKQYWSHDFGGTGTIRARRSHRGRGAIKDSTAVGDEKFHFIRNKHNVRYYFTGEEDYSPIVWRTSDPALAIDAFRPPKRKFPSPPKRTRPLSPNKHGHNQFTPKDQMVKYGAPHKGATWLRYRNRVNAFLPRDKTPPNSGRKTGMSALTAPISVEESQLPGTEAANTQGKELKRKRCSDEFMFMGQSDSDNTPAKKNKNDDGTANADVELAKDEGLGVDVEESVDEEDDDDPLGLSVLAEEYVPDPIRPVYVKRVQPPDFLTQLLTAHNESESANGEEAREPDAVTQDETADHPRSNADVSKLVAELAAMKKVIEAKDAQIAQLEKELKAQYELVKL